MSGIRGYLAATAVIVLAALGMVALVTVKTPIETDSLTIISPHPDSVKSEFKRAFEEWHKREMGEAVEVEWLDTGGGTQDQLRFITTRFETSPSGIGVDIFWGGGVDPYIELKKRHLLTPYRLPDEILHRIPAKCAGLPVYDPGFEWYGAALSGFGIIYNKRNQQKLKLPVPSSWKDLCRPELFRLVAAADPRQSGSMHTMFEIILRAYGWEEGFAVLTKMSGNVKNYLGSASQVPQAVSLGEAIYGPAIDFYAWSQMARDGRENIGFVMPRGATVVNPDAIGILKGAAHLQLAESFVRFVMSPAGQKLWILPKGAPGGPKEFELNRISVIPELQERYRDISNVPFNPGEFKEGIAYDSAKASRRWAVLNDLFGALLVDTHAELAAAWKALIERGKPDESLLKKFVSVPVTEDELGKLAQAEWKDGDLRNKTLSAWIEFARKKYRDAAKGQR